MSTNIHAEHISAFAALTSGQHDKFALFSCFLDGEPAVAIVIVKPPETDGGIPVHATVRRRNRGNGPHRS